MSDTSTLMDAIPAMKPQATTRSYTNLLHDYGEAVAVGLERAERRLFAGSSTA